MTICGHHIGREPFDPPECWVCRIEEEREACAAIAESVYMDAPLTGEAAAAEIAALIHARSNRPVQSCSETEDKK